MGNVDFEIKGLERMVAKAVKRYVALNWDEPVPHTRMMTFFTSRDPETGEMVRSQTSPNNWVYNWWKKNTDSFPEFDDFVLEGIVDGQLETRARELSSGQRTVEYALGRFLDYYEENPESSISLLKYFRDFDPITNTELERAQGNLNAFQARYQQEKKKKGKSNLKFENFIFQHTDDSKLKKDIRRLLSLTRRKQGGRDLEEQRQRQYHKRERYIKSRVRRYVIRYHDSGTYVPLTKFFTDMERGVKYMGNHKGDMNDIYERWRLGEDRQRGASFIDYVLGFVDEDDLRQKARDIDSGKRNVVWLLERYVRLAEQGKEMTLTNYFQNFSSDGYFRGNGRGYGHVFYKRWQESADRLRGQSFAEYITCFVDSIDRDLARKALKYDRSSHGVRDMQHRKRA